MARAFATFMNDGLEVQPHLIEAVRNTAGETLYQFQASPPRRLLDEDISHQMTSMMGAVVLHGTGTQAQLPGRDVAGKTGTSQDYRDAWFVGYTGDYTAAVWIGHDDHSPMARITGGTIPAAIWTDTIRVAEQGLEPRPLPGIEQPRYSPREEEMSSFFDSLRDAFGGGDGGDKENDKEEGDNNGFPDIFH
jgi:penicillin-binding protein 1A